VIFILRNNPPQTTHTTKNALRSFPKGVVVYSFLPPQQPAQSIFQILLYLFIFYILLEQAILIFYGYAVIAF
jgi:hypothetical protein